MRYLLALLFPCISFFIIGKPIQGLLCLILQLTIIGWLPATIWAILSIANHDAEKRTDKIVSAMHQKFNE